MDYSLPGPDDRNALGKRARRLRDLLGMTVSQLATEANVSAHEIDALEGGGEVSLDATLAIHRVLSGEGAGDALFTRPLFRSLDEVEACERRRRGGR